MRLYATKLTSNPVGSRCVQGVCRKGLQRNDYLRPGFHPDDIDTNALMEKWHTELCGAEGALFGHLE